MKRVALYARYSSENQRDASIEDQLRLCREHADRQGWQVVDSYSDRAISGASLIRPGIQELMHDAQGGRFDIVLAEAMDRLSRDQEDVAAVYKRLVFAGVKIVTLSEGEIQPKCNRRVICLCAQASCCRFSTQRRPQSRKAIANCCRQQ